MQSSSISTTVNTHPVTKPSSPPRLDYNYVLECFRPNQEKAPGSKQTCAPGEENFVHRHQHSNEIRIPSTVSVSTTAASSSRYVWCPNCIHESTAELNNESKSEQQS